MAEERKPAMSIDEIEAVLVDLPEEQLDDLMDRVAVRRGLTPEIEQSWVEEVKRRVAEYDRGEVEGIPMEETLAKMRAMLR
jgi:putative addiction module component (TIGR02574 family)